MATALRFREAVARANAGAVITIKPGRYSGPVTIDRAVTIRGGDKCNNRRCWYRSREDRGQGVSLERITLSSRTEINRPKHHTLLIAADNALIDSCDLSCSSLAGPVLSQEQWELNSGCAPFTKENLQALSLRKMPELHCTIASSALTSARRFMSDLAVT